MHLYIGNASRQNVAFMYRVLESTGIRTQHIPIGSQVKISGDLSSDEIEYIVGQHRKYGLTPADEIDRKREFVGTVYSVGKPIPYNKIMDAMNRNIFVLVERGKQIRQEAAIAEAVKIENDLVQTGRPESLSSFEATIVEENPGGRNAGPAMSEGLRVTRNANPDGSPKETAKTGRGRRKAA